MKTALTQRSATSNERIICPWKAKFNELADIFRRASTKLIVCMMCCGVSLFAQSISIASPTPAQTLSGLSFTFKVTLSSLPTVASVEYFVNSESQAIVWSPPWSLDWNTHNMWNSVGAGHWVYAVARDFLGNTLATSPTVNFKVSNTYGEDPAYMTVSSVSTSTPIGSNWSGSVTITATLAGTNAMNSCGGYGYVDGDSRNQNVTCGGGTVSWSLDTTRFSNGQHRVWFSIRDSGRGVAPWNGGGGFPIALWEQNITFANNTANMELWVNQKEWVLAPGNTLQLTCSGTRANLSTSSPACTWTSANPSVCTVNASTGLVTASAFGTCQINVVASGYPQRSIFGYVSSDNFVRHFETDGQIHTTDAGNAVWFASAFTQNVRSGFTSSSVRGGGDPQLASDALFGDLYKQAGFTVIDGSIPGSDANGNTNYCGDGVISEATWKANVAAFVNAFKTNILTPFQLYFHGIGTNLMQNVDGTGNSVLYDCTSGFGRNYATHAWAYFAAQWQAAGALGLEGSDEIETAYNRPISTPAIGNDGFTSLTCNSSTAWTINYTNIPHWGGNGYSFSIHGATSHAALNLTPGPPRTQAGLYIGTLVDGNTVTFTGPMCGPNTVVNAASDPGLVYEPYVTQWEAAPGGGSSYTPYQAFSNQITDLRSATPHPMFTSPVSAGGGANAQYWWMGDPATSDYAVCYQAQDEVPYRGHPQHRALASIASDGTGNGTDMGDRCRLTWGRLQSPRGWLAEWQSTPLFYGFQALTESVASISGSTVTFSAPHGIYNILGNCGTRMVISGSANSYYNKHWCIDSAPTATTVKISSPVADGLAARGYNSGNSYNFHGSTVVTWQNGDTSTFSALSYDNSITFAGGMAYTPFDNCKHRGMTFTVANASGLDSYFSSNTFMYMAHQATGPSFPTCYSSGQYDQWTEVPPAGQASGAATALLWSDSSYIRGRNYNGSEMTQGLWNSSGTAWYSAVLGAMGGRAYSLGTNNSFIAPNNGITDCLGSDSIWGDAGADCQSGDSPLYANGEADNIRDFWAFASANLLLGRLANAQYLFEPRYGCPDYGFYLECSLRKGSKGNLLMFYNVADNDISRTVDISSCAITNQQTIKYVADWKGITLSTLAPGITGDSATWPRGGVIFYLCSNNAAGAYQPPTISARLSDVPNATKIVIQYSHVPFMLNQRTDNIIDCGAGTCTVPWDNNVGKLYYRLQYLGSNGQLLASSDVQSL